LFITAIGRSACACEDQTVRDAAFAQSRDVHRLCVIANAGDSAARRTHERLETWLQDAAKDLNVELVRVAADQAAVVWTEYGLPSAPPSLPVVVLAGRRSAERRSFFIDHWDPAPTADDLEQLKTSPTRRALQRELVRRLAALLYVRGTGDRNRRTEAALQAVIGEWSAREAVGVGLVRADRSDPRERLLLAFVGADRTREDWVAVVFGRGKFMTPLIGDDITEAGLNACLDTLVGACTCLKSPSLLGVDIPMVWDEALDAAVVPLRAGGDPNASKRIRTGLAETRVSRFEGPMLATTLWTLGALALVLCGATVVIVWRRRRYEPRSPSA
jgi:hypothetical protein